MVEPNSLFVRGAYGMDGKSPVRILVVEDDNITARAIALTLTDEGYDVVGRVASGEEAISRAFESHPDLVLMDIQLEGLIDGVLAAHQIQGTLDIPVVYLTAYADDETLKRVIYSRPYGYISKPFQQEELLDTIETALSRHQVRQRTSARR
jgi:CheY-like chemotaxis protein